MVFSPGIAESEIVRIDYSSRASCGLEELANAPVGHRAGQSPRIEPMFFHHKSRTIRTRTTRLAQTRPAKLASEPATELIARLFHWVVNYRAIRNPRSSTPAEDRGSQHVALQAGAYGAKKMLPRHLTAELAQPNLRPCSGGRSPFLVATKTRIVQYTKHLAVDGRPQRNEQRQGNHYDPCRYRSGFHPTAGSAKNDLERCLGISAALFRGGNFVRRAFGFSGYLPHIGRVRFPSRMDCGEYGSNIRTRISQIRTSCMA